MQSTQRWLAKHTHLLLAVHGSMQFAGSRGSVALNQGSGHANCLLL